MSLNWNFKVWGAVIVVALLLSVSGAFLSTIERENESVSILARVNNDGSGIFVKNDAPDLKIDIIDGWGGLTFMTPGSSSIQHMILSDIVKDLGLDFIQDRRNKDSDTVYWTEMSPGNMLNYMFTSPANIAGGIAWEPHFATAIDDGRCKKVALTSEHLPNHPCCVIAANNTFLSGNEEAVERFLAGYSESVQWILNALADHSSKEYQYLLELTINIGTPEATNATQMSKETAQKALDNIAYAYEISNLEDQLAEVIETYEELGIVQISTLTDAGFESFLAFTQHLIQGQYLEGAFHEDELIGGELVKGVRKTPEELGYNDGDHITTINVAYLAADIHQIALHVGDKLGFFIGYGIHVNLHGPFNSGGQVMNALLSRHSDLGFVGSPPVVSFSINALRS